ARCAALNIPESVLPQIHDSSGVIGAATALPGSPPIAGIAGDQQASLVGQGCLRPGTAKATFGTGGMLDCAIGAEQPAFAERGTAGTFPMVAWSTRSAGLTWGVEAVMLSAGTCVEWLRDDLGIVESAAETDALAGSVADAGGVYFVPALLGLGTPVWDFGARGTLLGITRGTTRAEIVRAVLEGVAHRGADLLEALVADSGRDVTALRVDGGMSANATFVQALANTTARPIEVAPVTEATTLGAAYLAGTAVGVWPSLEATSALRQPRAVVEPTRRVDRERWLDARGRAERTIPELSAINF
ncbi:MAG TPA: FGGY-family carbohydrate kinase, partial [Acidimicrobiales bacterium]|nr:FGGY-family carbohydrate kinase [Acidimicrobiales bacterium]